MKEIARKYVTCYGGLHVLRDWFLESPKSRPNQSLTTSVKRTQFMTGNQIFFRKKIDKKFLPYLFSMKIKLLLRNKITLVGMSYVSTRECPHQHEHDITSQFLYVVRIGDVVHDVRVLERLHVRLIEWCGSIIFIASDKSGKHSAKLSSCHFVAWIEI